MMQPVTKLILTNMNKSFLLLLLIILSSHHNYSQDLEAVEIVRKSVELFDSETMKSELSMRIVRPTWENEIQLKTWTKDHRYALVLITAPARERGQSYLKRNNDLWNWLPNIQRTIKLSATIMMQSWMGSDFTYEDIMHESSFLTDYHHNLLLVEELRGVECYKIELIPLEHAPVVWGKIHLWISTADFFRWEAHFFDDRHKLVRKMSADDLKQFRNSMMPTRIQMQPAAQLEQKTVMILHNIELDIPLDDGFFSQQNMKRVR